MGRGRRRSREKESQKAQQYDASKVVILLSSDDEEANEDLSLEIINKCRLRELKRKREEDKEKDSAFFYDLTTSSADDIAEIPNRTATEVREGIAPEGGQEMKKKRKKKLKKKKRKDVEEEAVTETHCAPSLEVEQTVPAEPLIEVNEASNNPVLRKLLRGPRYFDSGHESWESCYNCGEEGHVAANCKEERRQKPCFVCGIFGHNAKNCTQGRDCFICKRKGHQAKDCPHKREKKSQETIICLRCGDLGHDMASCRNNYATCDIKEIQCYICKKYGHLCCVDYDDIGPSQISCYNCAEPGHTGQGCAKQRGESNVSTPSTLFCYSCGQEGHFARGCTKGPKSVKRYGESSAPPRIMKDKEDSKLSLKRNGESSSPISWSKAKKDIKVSKISKSVYKRYGESSTPVSRTKEKRRKKDSKVSRSLSKDYGRDYAEGSPYFNGSTRPVKSKVKGGWIVDDTINLPKRKHMINNWASPITPQGRGNLNYSNSLSGYPSGSRYSTPYTPYQRNNYYAGTPNSHGFIGGYNHGFASRFGNSYDYYG